MCQHDQTGRTECVKKDRSENSAGKAQCGTCGHKAVGKWLCRYSPSYACPVNDPTVNCVGFFRKSSTIRPPQPKKKGLPVPPGVKFLYFGRPPKGVDWSHKDWECYQRGVITVAWIIPEPGVLHLGFSFCSPKDPWCKVTGRDMALARLLHPVVVPYLYSPKRTAREVARAVMTHDFGRLAALTPGATMWRTVPSWTKGLAKRMEVGAKIKRVFIFHSSPRLKKTPFNDALLQYKKDLEGGKGVGPYPGYFWVDEAAPIPPEAWERLSHPKPTASQVVARMMADIAKLGE